MEEQKTFNYLVSRVFVQKFSMTLQEEMFDEFKLVYFFLSILAKHYYMSSCHFSILLQK